MGGLIRYIILPDFNEKWKVKRFFQIKIRIIIKENIDLKSLCILLNQSCLRLYDVLALWVLNSFFNLILDNRFIVNCVIAVCIL